MIGKVLIVRSIHHHHHHQNPLDLRCVFLCSLCSPPCSRGQWPGGRGWIPLSWKNVEWMNDHILRELLVWLTLALPPPVLPLHLKTLYKSSICLGAIEFEDKEARAAAIHNGSETGALPPGLDRWETYSHWLTVVGGGVISQRLYYLPPRKTHNSAFSRDSTHNLCQPLGRRLWGELRMREGGREGGWSSCPSAGGVRHVD